ncbi:MAG TPA: hypothetical protein PK156_05180 [Polyangium sp.]|nr:hypothetical protein [Polyangium sp.]
MKTLRYALATLALSASIAVVGCGGDPDSNSAGDEITQEDVVDLGDLIIQDNDATAAATVIGEPATLLAEGQRQGEKARADVAAVLGFVRQLATGGPTRKGTRADGKAFAFWNKQIVGKSVSLLLLRVEDRRLRYLVVLDNADGTHTPLMTGIFVKKGPGTGGGRFHVNLTNVSNAFGAPNADGEIHFWFANHTGDKRGRRIVYRNVVRRDDAEKRVRNYGADLVRLVNVGGRFRSISIDDFVGTPQGNEAMGMRMLWKAGVGGRGSAAVVSLGTKQLLGTAHECWDANGLRSAYKDDDPSNGMTDPDEGEVTMCAGFADEPPPDTGNVSENGMDADPELDALLQESGAMDISESDANMVDNAGI